MRRREFEAFTRMALFLADRGDGALEDAEIRTLLALAAGLGSDWGLRPKKAMQAAVSTADAYLQERIKGTAALQETFHACADHLQENVDPAMLPRLYEDLVRVATSDGMIELGEKQILRDIRARWRLGQV